MFLHAPGLVYLPWQFIVFPCLSGNIKTCALDLSFVLDVVSNELDLHLVHTSIYSFICRSSRFPSVQGPDTPASPHAYLYLHVMTILQALENYNCAYIFFSNINMAPAIFKSAESNRLKELKRKLRRQLFLTDWRDNKQSQLFYGT